MCVSVNEKIAFKEVNEIISIMGKEYKEKVPKQLIELLEREEYKGYITKIKKNLPLNNKPLVEQHLFY